jgi:hypothetical protein
MAIIELRGSDGGEIHMLRRPMLQTVEKPRIFSKISLTLFEKQ